MLVVNSSMASVAFLLSSITASSNLPAADRDNLITRTITTSEMEM